jgi:hypothetical protein
MIDMLSWIDSAEDDHSQQIHATSLGYNCCSKQPQTQNPNPTLQEIGINDIVRGQVTWNTDNLGDFVVLRSNGLPVYNFCVAIDDALMGITHVLRAEEHLPNTLRQVGPGAGCVRLPCCMHAAQMRQESCLVPRGGGGGPGGGVFQRT